MREAAPEGMEHCPHSSIQARSGTRALFDSPQGLSKPAGDVDRPDVLFSSPMAHRRCVPVRQHKEKAPYLPVRSIFGAPFPSKNELSTSSKDTGRPALLIIEVHHDAVIEQIDGIDKTVDDLFLKGDIRRVARDGTDRTRTESAPG